MNHPFYFVSSAVYIILMAFIAIQSQKFEEQ